MAVSTLICILIFHFGVVTVQGYVCVHQNQSHSQSDVDCASLSGSKCKFSQEDNLIHKENNSQDNDVNFANILPKETNDNGHGDVSNSVSAKAQETGGSSESNIDPNTNLNEDLQNVIKHIVTNIIRELITNNDDQSKTQANTGITKQSNVIDISDIGEVTKEQIKYEIPSGVNNQSTNEMNCSCNTSNSGLGMSDTANHSESEEKPHSALPHVTQQQYNNIQNPLIIFNNQQTIASVTNSLNGIIPDEYREQSNRIFTNMEEVNPPVSPNKGIGIHHGNLVNLNSGTTSYTLVTIPNDNNYNSGVNSGTSYTLNNIPCSFDQLLSADYRGVQSTVQSYNTIQLSDGQTIFVPSNNGQTVLGNGLGKLVPLNNLQASVVRMQNAIRQNRFQVPCFQQMPLQVFQVLLNN